MDKIIASEALFGFMGWLTTLDEPVTFSARHDAGIAAELVGEFCKANGLQEPRDGWEKLFIPPTTRKSHEFHDGDSTEPIVASI